MKLSKTIIELLSALYKKEIASVPLHAPTFLGNELLYLKDCIDTGWVSSVGSYVDRFEADLAAYCGVRRAVAVVNGTAALQVALVLVGVRRDEEVIMPSLTFVATANAARYIGAWPHFVDVEEETLGLSPEMLEEHLNKVARVTPHGVINCLTGRRIAAIVPMHTFGHPVRLDEILTIANRFGLPVVEDAAESLGSFYKGTHTGTKGVVSAISFNGNKIITTGGGGAILTNDEELGRLAKHLTTTARSGTRWEYSHDMVGYNYRMPNLNAALGVAQLEQLPQFLAEKRQLAETYREIFRKMTEITFIDEPAACISNFWLTAAKLQSADQKVLTSILEETNSVGIMTRPLWTPLHFLAPYRDCFRADLSVTESLSLRMFNLPSGCGIAHFRNVNI